MEFVVNEKIGGTGEYREALREHAMNGKLLALAQAQAVKAAQEFIHVHLKQITCERDVTSIKKLRDKCNGEEGAETHPDLKDADISVGVQLLHVGVYSH
ncbi:hypothetical protein BDV06DRAFT_202212 [Aspergillus oleicola]